MALKSDNQGFLIGDPVDIGKTVNQLKQIRTDISDIKRALIGANSGNKGSKTPAIENNAKIMSPLNGRNQGNKQSSTVATPTRSKSDAKLLDFLKATPRGTVTPKGRNASGQFTAKGTAAGAKSAGQSASNGNDKNSQSIIRNFSGRVATVAAGATAGVEEADPTIKAFKEVAEPMRRGYEIFTGGGDKKDRWYKKIFKELNLFRKDESVFNKAQNKVLKSIEEKPVSSAASGGGLGALLGGKGVGGLMGGLGKGLLGGGKGLLKKIPFLGALIGGVSAASDIYGAENDDSLTRGEKDKRDGKAVGGLAGSVGGMMAGAKLGAMAGALGGPIGVAIGGVVGGAAGMFFGDQAGQIIGEKAGEWTAYLREADIPGKIIGAWNETTDAIKNGWDGALKLMSDAWVKIKDAGTDVVDWVADKANSANNFIEQKTGVNVKNKVVSGVDKAKQGAEWVGNNTTIGKGVKAIGGKIGDRWKDAKQYLTGASEKAGIDPGIVAKVANFESGFNSDATPTRKDGSKISSAHGYGQFLDGTWKDMVNKYGAKYGIEGADKMTSVQADKYRNDKTVQAGMLAEFTRENVEKGRKFGGTNDDANVYALHNLGEGTGPEFLKALKNNPNAPVNSVKGMSDKVISGNKSLYGDGKITLAEAYAKMGNAMSRGDSFAKDIRMNAPPSLHNLATGAGSVNQTQTAFAAAPKIPAFTQAPAPAEAPPQITQLASLDSGRNNTVTMPSIDVGQDVRDRGIAHIVTGGIGGRG